MHTESAPRLSLAHMQVPHRSCGGLPDNLELTRYEKCINQTVWGWGVIAGVVMPEQTGWVGWFSIDPEQ